MIALKPPVHGRVDLKCEIAHEIYQALEKLDASPELLGIIGIWSDWEGDTPS
jgi:hypothetical protein